MPKSLGASILIRFVSGHVFTYNFIHRFVQTNLGSEIDGGSGSHKDLEAASNIARTGCQQISKRVIIVGIGEATHDLFF
jgi:hypothetical protein